MLCFSASAAEFSLSVADITSPVFTARGIRLVLPDDGSADLRVASLTAQQREFSNVHIRCAGFELSSLQVVCRDGRVDAIPDAKLNFSYEFETRQMRLALDAKGDEFWRMDARLGEREWQVSAELRNAQGKRLADFSPPEIPSIGQGALTGKINVSGNATGLQKLEADVSLIDVAFSDVSGLHAAEKLRGQMSFSAKRQGALWAWQGKLHWQSGEIFWQPLYIQSGSGHSLDMAGYFDGKRLSIDRAQMDVPEVGRIVFSGSWDSEQKKLLDGTVHGEKLALAKLFENYAKPFLDKGMLAGSTLQGHADVDAVYRDGALQSLRLGLLDASIADAGKRYALQGVNSDIDWQANAPRTAIVEFKGGILFGSQIGAGRWTVMMNGMDFKVSQAELPVLDGTLALNDFHLFQKQGGWRWQFGASLVPVSMEQLSIAAGWPKMLGRLAGRIPKVSYDGNEISADGALLFNVFDGTVVATQLKLADAFGLAPKLSGNLAMRNLDLDLLTRTFSFGNMLGRLDVDVKNLQLQNWQPVRFEARLFSSSGNYPRKISQKAVQNISALGGAGAVAAIQRSYLRFFENFGYDRIGLSCMLRNGVCEMSGIDPTNSGTYTIVKGGGIPSITVMGYNRTVSWGELVNRLKRVTQGDVKPVVK